MKTQLYCFQREGTIHVGAYQSIFLIELDHPRSREVLVKIVGE